MNPWIGVDLDGTLAHYDKWRGAEHIGEPILPMVRRVQQWLDEGKDVRIFTARAHEPGQIPYVEKWCVEVFGRVLPVTNTKDFGMVMLWDDRCVRVVLNTGVVCTGCSIGAY